MLDEPTNHLDLDMRNAMEMALQGYEGALILVSHDRHLLRNTADELLLVHDGLVEEYEDDLKAYEKWILASYRSSDKPAAGAVPAADVSRKEKRQQAAAQRARLRPLQQDISKTERAMTAAEQTLAKLQEQLADPELYTDGSKDALGRLLKEEGELKTQAAQLEERWLELQQTLEELNAELAAE